MAPVFRTFLSENGGRSLPVTLIFQGLRASSTSDARVTDQGQAVQTSALQDIPIDYPLSRGRSNDRPLLPSALRCDSDGKMLCSKSTTRSFLDALKVNFFHISKITPFPMNNMNGWFLNSQKRNEKNN